MKPIAERTLSHLLSPRFQRRFWARVMRTEDDDCWLWTHSVNNKWYGQVNWGRHTGRLLVSLSHRTAWILFHKQCVPDNQLVLHSCDHPRCCNPSHLTLGTQLDNVQDMDKKGRRKNKNLIGEAHGMSRLKVEDVKEIRGKFGSGRFLQSELADVFGVGRSTIANIVHRRTWRHI